MRVKIKNIFKKKSKEDAEIIKFSDDENTRIRKGAIVSNEKIRKGDKRNKKELKKINLNKDKRSKIIKYSEKIFIPMVLLLVLSSTLNIKYKDYLSFKQEDESSISNESITASTNIDTKASGDIAPITKVENKVVTKKAEQKLVFSPPVKGEIQKMYSIDKVIYSKTLNQWKTHDGIDIAADENTTVKAIERGVVDKIYDDAFYGKTIEIEHILGYKSIYSNLGDKVYVNVGESVSKGQKIGVIGKSSVGEYLDDFHLHFMLYQNEKSVDPTYILD